MVLTTITRLSPRSFQLWSLLALWILFGSCFVHDVSAQTVVNGQTYTNGLAIVNSPALGSTITVGSTMNFAIDVTGNGQISPDSSNANSTATTRITYLAAYLISEPQFTNITVVQGFDFITGQPGSSVKQAGFTVPSCAAPGSYSLTIYEGSVINGTDCFTITPIPVRITTPRPGGVPCSPLFNDILPDNQTQSPPPVPPWGIPPHVTHSSSGSGLPSTSTASSSAASTVITSSASVSVTTSASGSVSASASASGTSTSGISASGSSTSDASTSDASTSDTSTLGISTTDASTAIASSDAPVTVTNTIDGQTSTVTVSARPSTITKVFSSVRTQVTTLTESGSTEVLTTTVEALSTSTKVVESAPSNPPGFFPVVNAAPRSSSTSSVVVTGFFALIYLLVM